jgi:hypothetical protein
MVHRVVNEVPGGRLFGEPRRRSGTRSAAAGHRRPGRTWPGHCLAGERGCVQAALGARAPQYAGPVLGVRRESHIAQHRPCPAQRGKGRGTGRGSRTRPDGRRAGARGGCGGWGVRGVGGVLGVRGVGAERGVLGVRGVGAERAGFGGHAPRPVGEDGGRGGLWCRLGYRVCWVVIDWTSPAACASHLAYAVGKPEACTPCADCHSGWWAQSGFAAWYFCSAVRNASDA